MAFELEQVSTSILLFLFPSWPGKFNATNGETRRVSRSKYRRPLKSKIMDPFFFLFFFPRILHCLFFFFSLIFRYRDERHDDKKKNCNPFPIPSDFRQGYFLEKRDYKSKTWISRITINNKYCFTNTNVLLELDLISLHCQYRCNVRPRKD